MIEAPAAMTAAPAVGPLPSVVPPTADRFTLSNGLEVVTVKSNHDGTVDVEDFSSHLDATVAADYRA